MDKESFDRDLERFEIEIMSEFESGLTSFKNSMSQHEFKLRSDMHSAIGGFMGYMRDRYGNGVTK